MKGWKAVDYALAIQGGYYFVTAVWPFAHLQSFEVLLGFKLDKFLLYTVSILILVVALSLIASIGQKKTRAIKVLSLGSPLAFIGVELWYQDTISSLYMVDTAIQIVLLGCLIYLYMKRSDK